MSENLNFDNGSMTGDQDNPLANEWIFDSSDGGTSEAEQNVESAAERYERLKEKFAKTSIEAYTLDEINEMRRELQELQKELKKEQLGADSSESEGGEKPVSPEEARKTLEKAKKSGGIKGFLRSKATIVLALVLAALIAIGGIAAAVHHSNGNVSATSQQETTMETGSSEADETQSADDEKVDLGELDEVHDWHIAIGGVDYDGDGARDFRAGAEIQWESQMDKLDEARYDDRETAWNFFDGSKMLSGGLGARPISLELMDEHRNFGEGSLEAWSENTLDATRHNMPSTIMGELIMHGTVMGDNAVREDGTIIDLSDSLAILENSDDEFSGKYQNQIAQDQHERFNNGTTVVGRTPNQYYSVQIATDKTSEGVRMEVVIVDTDKLEGEDLQNEARQWIDVRQEDGKLFFDDSEELERYLVAYLGLPEGTKLEVHSDNSGGNQICAWVIDEDVDNPGSQEQSITPVNPNTGSEGTGSEGTGSEGTGSEGTGSEGTGSEGTGSEGTGTEGTGSETSDWGKSGNTHAGDNVDVSDPVDPNSEVTRNQSEGANNGNQGYVNDNQATPGSSSGNNGGSGNTGITAPGATSGDRLTGGGSNQGGNQPAGTNNSAPAVTPEATGRDNTGNANQGNAQNNGVGTGGNNYSDSQEEDLVNNGDF